MSRMQVDRAVADGMDDDVEAGRSAPDGPRVEVVRRVHEQSTIVRRVGEGLEERRGVRAERAVDESLERADA